LSTTEAGETVTAKAGKQLESTNRNIRAQNDKRVTIDLRKGMLAQSTGTITATLDFSNPIAEEKKERLGQFGGETMKD
jgi:hypothetical protein